MTLQEEQKYLWHEIGRLRKELRAAFRFKNKDSVTDLYGRLSVFQGIYYDVTEALKKVGEPDSDSSVGTSINAAIQIPNNTSM